MQPDGLLYRCKACTRAYVEANRERIRATHQRWTEQNADQIRESQQRYSHSDAGHATQQRYREHNRERVREHSRAYYWRDHERALSQNRAYQVRNRDKINAAERERHDQNREAYRLRLRTWKRNNPEKVKADVHARNAKKRANGGRYTAEEWEALKRFYGYHCLCCGRCEPEIKLEVDHVIPVHLGGPNTIDNLQPLCGFCNRSKGVDTTDYR